MSLDDEIFRGLSLRSSAEWPKTYVREGQFAIDFLKPGSTQHDLVLEYLVGRIEASERSMSAFYSRWQQAEMRYQAYVSLPHWEKKLKEANASGQPPLATSIVLPVSFAILNTITTYMIHTFAGRRPILQVGSYKDESVEPAKNMEMLLQMNCDHTKMVYKMFQSFQDGQIYGMSALRPVWVEEFAYRTRRQKIQKTSLFGANAGEFQEATRERTLIYQGNEVFNQDPYMFFPDTRVPMTEVNKRGEFVFWRNFEGRHQLLRMQADGVFKWVESATTHFPTNRYWFSGSDNSSARALLSGGRQTPAINAPDALPTDGAEYMQVDQGTCVIIPRELGLGESIVPEKWLFTILNKAQIVQAEPFDHDHDLHPVAVSEPYALGYGFGNPGMADYLGTQQDIMGWLMNSHIDNVRKSLNDVFVVDPSAVEMQDLKNPTAGKFIRLKRSAIGKDVRQVLQQLNVADVTGKNIQDMQVFLQLAQMMSAISENLMGIQSEGGRKTATEVRTSAQAAVSRLAALCRVVSSQQMVDMTKILTLNTLQFIDDDFYFTVLGAEGQQSPIRITPDMLNGDFTYPTHDGTLPADRIASFDIWKEILMGILKDPELRQSFSVSKIFEYVAELGGATNIESMRVTPDEAMEKQMQMGNAVPMSQAGQLPGASPDVRALPERDAARAPEGAIQ